ncbi:unnamed protein product [Effrenium voratum]|uniref:Uncharacterized protein n=1 Tax=Effrenium voratum TaxID=2562239 RepID=A0AA36J9N0_9DINO|nr:unnamed protein product [Effrenium voratum]CAJ1401235.1 unnamed protein product [Effrenium voratum]CAJ1421077.1 unnamed protein product [Effrenium voratum]
MAARLDRLANSAEIAEESNKRLLVVEATLNDLPGQRSDKAIHALMGFIGTNKQALKQTAWSVWLGTMLRAKGERNLRARYDKEVQEAADYLERFKARHLENIRRVVCQAARREEEELLTSTLADWKSQITRFKAEAWTEDKVKTMQLTISKATKDMCGRAKKVMTRMIVDEQGSSIAACFGAWVQYGEGYKKDKVFEDSVKQFEQKMKVYMEKKKEDAVIVLNRMSVSTETGLVQQTFTAWNDYTFGGKQLRELEDEVYGTDDQLAYVKSNHRKIAASISSRTGDQIDMNLMYQCWMVWNAEGKTSRLDRFYSVKIDAKRKQLSSVQLLFKTFAEELDSGLKDVADNDSSGREKRRAKAEVNTMSGSVSLPDIHAKKH